MDSKEKQEVIEALETARTVSTALLWQLQDKCTTTREVREGMAEIVVAVTNAIPHP